MWLFTVRHLKTVSLVRGFNMWGRFFTEKLREQRVWYNSFWGF